MILAAGRGERMRPLTDHVPKPLLEVGGTPLIEHAIARLVKGGISELVINLGYRGEQIVEHRATAAASARASNTRTKAIRRWKPAAVFFALWNCWAMSRSCWSMPMSSPISRSSRW